jgi:exodeoxyribonuclease VII large subunit
MSLTVQDIDESYTVGEISRNKQETLERLLAAYPDQVQLIDGVLATFNKSLPLPLVVKRIAYVSSLQGQGAEDFLNELVQNRFGYGFHVVPFQTLVQGDDAPRQICQALETIADSGEDYDLVVIVRGGGAQTDLFAFDAFEVAAHVALFPIPILAGIGHTRDVSITDTVAALSLKTPTKAAQWIVERNLQADIAVKKLIANICSFAADRQRQEAREFSKRQASIAGAAGTTLHSEKVRRASVSGRVFGAADTALESESVAPGRWLRSILTSAKQMQARHGMEIGSAKTVIRHHARAMAGAQASKTMFLKKYVLAHAPGHWLALGGAVIEGAKKSIDIGDTIDVITKHQKITAAVADIRNR